MRLAFLIVPVMMALYGCTAGKPPEGTASPGASRTTASTAPPADLTVGNVSFRQVLTTGRDAYRLQSPVLVIRRGDPGYKHCQGISTIDDTTPFLVVCDNGTIVVGQQLADDMMAPPGYPPVAVVYELSYELATKARTPEPLGTSPSVLKFARPGQQVCAGVFQARRSSQWRGDGDLGTLRAFVARKLGRDDLVPFVEAGVFLASNANSSVLECAKGS